jgi:hypothetical protein
MTRKPLSPEAKAAAIARLNEVIRKFCEDVEQRKTISKSDRALDLFEKGIDTPTICERLGIGIHSIHAMLRCARNKRARAMVRLCDEMGANI